MNKLAQMIEEMSYDDLLLLRKDFEEGNLRRVLEERIRAFENPMLVCPVCGREVSEDSDIVLVFGPKELRKKARFCGKDCLQHFVRENA